MSIGKIHAVINQAIDTIRAVINQAMLKPVTIAFSPIDSIKVSLKIIPRIGEKIRIKKNGMPISYIVNHIEYDAEDDYNCVLICSRRIRGAVRS